MKRLYAFAALPQLLGGLLLLFPLFLRAFFGAPLVPGVVSYATSSHPYWQVVGLLGDGAILLSIALGLLSIDLFRRITPAFARTHEARSLALILFIINPFFLALFTSLRPLTVALPLLLSLFLVKRSYLPVPLIALLFFLPLEAHRFAPSIAEFGAVGGISLLYAILAVLEGSLRWNENRSRLFFTLFLAVLLLSPYNDTLLLFAAVAAVPFVAHFLRRIQNHAWTLQEARPIILLLLLCSFLFLIITQSVAITEQQPTREMVGLLSLVKEEKGCILAPDDLVPLVEHFTPGSACRIDPTPLYAARSIEEARPLVQQQSIRYLLITEEQRNTLWLHDEDGLLFLLKHSKHFTLVGETAAERLWRYEGQNLY